MANKSLSTPLLEPQPPRPLSSISTPHSRSDRLSEDRGSDDEEIDGHRDVDMEDVSSAGATPPLSAHPDAPTSAYTSPQSIAMSPAMEPPLRSHQSTYTSSSSLPSPAFKPQNDTHSCAPNAKQGMQNHPYVSTNSRPLLPLSNSTSPILAADYNKEHDDHEATAALLMLNQDRRGAKSTVNSKVARGLSVKDLLSC